MRGRKLAALVIRFRYEINEGYRGRYCQSRMPRLKPLVLSITSVSRSIKAAQLRKVMG